MSVETIVDETDADAAEMVVTRLGLSALHPTARILGFRDRDGIRGAFYFERYTGPGGSIHAHWVGRDRHWLKGYMLTLAFMYVYDQLGCEIIYGEVKSKSVATRIIDEKLGFREVARLEGYYPGDDLILYALRKQDCIWLPDEFKEETPDGEGRRAAGA